MCIKSSMLGLSGEMKGHRIQNGMRQESVLNPSLFSVCCIWGELWSDNSNLGQSGCMLVVPRMLLGSMAYSIDLTGAMGHYYQ